MKSRMRLIAALLAVLIVLTAAPVAFGATNGSTISVLQGSAKRLELYRKLNDAWNTTDTSWLYTEFSAASSGNEKVARIYEQNGAFVVVGMSIGATTYSATTTAGETFTGSISVISTNPALGGNTGFGLPFISNYDYGAYENNGAYTYNPYLYGAYGYAAPYGYSSPYNYGYNGYDNYVYGYGYGYDGYDGYGIGNGYNSLYGYGSSFAYGSSSGGYISATEFNATVGSQVALGIPSGKEGRWASGNAGIATVGADGYTVTFVGPGTVTFTFTPADGSASTVPALTAYTKTAGFSFEVDYDDYTSSLSGYGGSNTSRRDAGQVVITYAGNGPRDVTFTATGNIEVSPSNGKFKRKGSTSSSLYGGGASGTIIMSSPTKGSQAVNVSLTY